MESCDYMSQGHTQVHYNGTDYASSAGRQPSAEKPSGEAYVSAARAPPAWRQCQAAKTGGQ